MEYQAPIHNLKTGKKGMTLIEVLIVVTIISILAGALLPNLNDLRRKARDQRRKADIKAIQEALESYKINQIIPSYPPTNEVQNGLSIQDGNAVYMKEVPTDPLYLTDQESYKYRYERDPSDSLKYFLGACMELSSGADLTDISQFDEDTCTGNTPNTPLWYIKTEP